LDEIGYLNYTGYLHVIIKIIMEGICNY